VLACTRRACRLRTPRAPRCRTHWYMPSPSTVPWKTGCRSLRQIDQRLPVDAAWRIKSIAATQPESRNGTSARRALAAAAAQMVGDLHARGVLCDADLPCRVTFDDADLSRLSLTACLPAAVSSSRLCEPWGERWQRTGAEVGPNFCARFDVTAIAAWYNEQALLPPFLRADGPPTATASGRQPETLTALLDTKPLRSRRHSAEQYAPERARMRALVRASASRAREHAAGGGSNSDAWDWPGTHRTCAVVGSGHDLRCGTRKGMGGEIDAATKVFRANSAQHYSLPSVGNLMRLALRSRRWWTLLFLLKTRLHWSRAGKRTDYRVNCLYASYLVTPNETCIVSRAWFEQRWGSERFMNVRHPCCDYAREHSNYTLSHLEALTGLRNSSSSAHKVGEGALNARIHFLRGASRALLHREPSLAALQRSSGGNALMAAVGLCQTVRLYGAGLYATSPKDDKRYLHFYDEAGIAQCGGRNRSEAGGPRYRLKMRKVSEAWRVDRLRHELFLHVLHALGVVQWRQ
jgi:hypothetical protein